MKKTAVEIAIFRIKQLQIGLSSSSQKIALEQVMDILEQAKEMEKKERMYSEEEVIQLLLKMNSWPTIFDGEKDILEWFEQNKNNL